MKHLNTCAKASKCRDLQLKSRHCNPFLRKHKAFTEALYLFATVDAVLAENRGAACGHPDTSQSVAVHLILLNDPLTFLMLKKKNEEDEDAVWPKIMSSRYRYFVLLPHRCPRAGRRGSCCAEQWGSCWFGSGFQPGRCHRCHYFLSNLAHLQICTLLLDYRWKSHWP